MFSMLCPATILPRGTIVVGKPTPLRQSKSNSHFDHLGVTPVFILPETLRHLRRPFASPRSLKDGQHE
jgi:hypothetical protein